MSEERNDLDEGPSEEASGQEENFDGNKSGLSETYDMRDFCPGIRIEAQDFDGKWHPAKVADVDWTENEVLVHFENLNTKFDEWIPMDSSRLRSLPKTLGHTGKESVKFVRGEEVMAVWSPYQKYPATIQAVLPNDRYDVLFYDGFLKRLKAHKISKLDDGIVRSDVRNFSDIGTKEERRERKRKINVAELFHMNKRAKKKGLVHSKEMKTYPVNKSRAKSSIVKKPLPVPEEKEAATPTTATTPAAGEASSKSFDGKVSVPAGNSSYMARSLVGTIPAAVKVKYLDGRTEMWSKQLYQRSEGRTAGKLDIVILNPQGRKFRSRNEIMKYCEENGIIYTHDSFDFSAKGRPKSKSVVQGQPKTTDSSLSSPDKISLKKLRRKSNPYEVLTPSPTIAQTASSGGAVTSLEGNNVAADDKVFIGDVEVVVENGKFICPVKVCGKHFRRENLLHMHMKHYHPEFSKYLDYTPSVTDLAYMRTVGSLETAESSPSVAKKPLLVAEKVDKTPGKVDKSGKSSGSVGSEGGRDAKKTPHKMADGLNETRLLSKLTTPSSPKIVVTESSEMKTPDADSSADASPYQTYKETTSHAGDLAESPGRLSHQSELDGGDVGARGAVGGTATTPSATSKSSVRHSRFYRQRKGVRIRGSFSDHIKRKKYMGQGDHSRRAPGQDSSVPGSVPSSASSSTQSVAEEDQSNASVTSQPPQTDSLKLRLKIPPDVSGEKLPTDDSDESLNGEKTRTSLERDPKSAYVLLEKTTDLGQRYNCVGGGGGGGGVGGEGRHSDTTHGLKRKRLDSKSGGGSRSKNKKKVLFESVTYTKWQDGNGSQSRRVSNSSAEVGLERRSKEKAKCSRYINYLNRREADEASGRGAVVPEPVGEDGGGADADADTPVDLDYTEGTEDSKSPFTVEHEKVEKLRRNEIINCTCGVTEEDGLMIQCDLCLCWQHGHCMNILRDSDVPDKYICSICKNPFRGRSSMKYVHDQEWLKEGTLPCLSFRSKREDIIEQRQTILKRSYDLSGSISLLSQVIHSLRVKVNIAEKKDHPKLWLWAKKWIEKKPTRIIDEVKEEKTNGTEIVPDKQKVLLPEEEQQLPKVPEPEAPIDSAECRLNLLDHLIHYQTLVDARLSCIESLVAELESMQDDAVDDEGPERYPRTKATIQMILRDLTTMNKIAVI